LSATARTTRPKRNCFQNDVRLDQETPLPIVITVWNKAENVAGGLLRSLLTSCARRAERVARRVGALSQGNARLVRRRMVIVRARRLCRQRAPVVRASAERQGVVQGHRRSPGGRPGDPGRSGGDHGRIAQELRPKHHEDVVCVALVGGEAEIIAAVSAGNFNVPKDRCSPSSGSAREEPVLLGIRRDRGLLGRRLTRSDLQTLYSKKKTMSFDDFARKELKLDEAAIGAFGESRRGCWRRYERPRSTRSLPP